MAELQRPHTRIELLAYLRAASARDLWRASAELKFLVHFVFDDNDFQITENLIGLVLLSHEEARAIRDFVAELDRAVGPRNKSLLAIREGEWAPVARSAAQALAILAATGTQNG